MRKVLQNTNAFFGEETTFAPLKNHHILQLSSDRGVGETQPGRTWHLHASGSELGISTRFGRFGENPLEFFLRIGGKLASNLQENRLIPVLLIFIFY